MIEIIIVEEKAHNPIGNCKHLVIFLAIILVIIIIIIIIINCNPPILKSRSSTYPILPKPQLRSSY